MAKYEKKFHLNQELLDYYQLLISEQAWGDLKERNIPSKEMQMDSWWKNINLI